MVIRPSLSLNACKAGEVCICRLGANCLWPRAHVHEGIRQIAFLLFLLPRFLVFVGVSFVAHAHTLLFIGRKQDKTGGRPSLAFCPRLLELIVFSF